MQQVFEADDLQRRSPPWGYHDIINATELVLNEDDPRKGGGE